MTRFPRASRFIALALAASLALPVLAVTAGCGPKGNDQMTTETNGGPPVNNSPMSAPPPAKPGLSGKQKVVLLAGAALLFYLYQHDKKVNAAAAQNGANGPGGKPQLFREEKGVNKGAIYYRKNDANHTIVWLSAPQQGMEVPADQVNQYLPDYSSNPNAYQGQVNTSPQPEAAGQTVQSADQYAGSGMPRGPGM